MLKPVNYADLFDRLYPDADIPGLRDTSEITVEGLNLRLAVIRNNERSLYAALNGILADAPDGTFFRDFLLPFYEVAAARRFVFSVPELAAAQFQTDFDAVGQGLSFPVQQTVLYLNHLGGQLTDESISVLVFSQQLLLPVSDFTLRAVQGGVIIYVNSSDVIAGSPIDVVVLRTFNQKGVTWNTPMTWVYSAVTVTTPLDFLVPSLGLLGNEYALRYYQMFSKVPNDNYFRPVDPTTVGSRMADTGDGAVFTVETGAVQNTVFMLVNTTGFWNYDWAGTVSPYSSQQWSIALLEADGVTPAPIACTEDVDLWVDGVMMRPNVDYAVTFGDPSVSTEPPRVVINGMTVGAHRIRAISNAPYDPIHSIQLQYPILPDPRGLVDVPVAGREIRLTEQLGILFSGGYFDGEGRVRTIADNLSLDLSSVTAPDDVFYRARFVFTAAGMAICEMAASSKTGLDKLLDLIGSVSGSTTDLGDPGDFRDNGDFGGVLIQADWKGAYATSNSIPANVPTNQRRGYPTAFDTGYFWTRDRLPYIQPSGGATLDCRTRTRVAQMTPWAEPPGARGGGGVGVDCRELQAGYTRLDLALDCRQLTS